ncbi:phosphoglycerate kinase [Patescibacteria group bacterium]
MKSIREAPIQKGTRVFVRCDIDVPLENGKILTTFRLDHLLPTLRYIIEKGGIPIIAGHIGKPGGTYVEELSTKHLKPYFDEKLGQGKFELLENLRFDPREIQNDKEYAEKLSKRAEVYVNESFATSHREHASFLGISTFLPCYAGLRLEEEIKTLDKLSDPERPFMVLVGGVKLESKSPVIEKFLEIADKVLLNSVLSFNWSTEIPQNLVLADNCKEEDMDLPPQTVDKYTEILSGAKTVLWVGPMGAYEQEEFIVGTRKIAEMVIEKTRSGDMYSVVGGGNTIDAMNKLGLLNKFSFTSTGGSAMLNYLAKRTLPGIEALN